MEKPQSNLEELLQNPKAAGLLQNKEALLALLRSPDTQRLMQLLNQNGGGSLKGAADAAAQGDTSRLMGLVNHVMGSAEGAALVERLNRSNPKMP